MNRGQIASTAKRTMELMEEFRPANVAPEELVDIFCDELRSLAQRAGDLRRRELATKERRELARLLALCHSRYSTKFVSRFIEQYSGSCIADLHPNHLSAAIDELNEKWL